MLTVKHLTYGYPGTAAPALRDLSIAIPEGAFVLVIGHSGAGKSTLLRALNGLVPHFHGGTFAGQVFVNGLDTLKNPPRVLARSVGFVFQDPETQFVVPNVEDEIAFSLENQGLLPALMSDRITEALERLEIAHLRYRQVSTLSGGEAQRVVIAAALAVEPQYLILDEPTSQLDPPAAHALFDTLIALRQRTGLTIVLAEHRLERVLPYASHILYLAPEGPQFGPVREILPSVPLRPALVEMGMAQGWSPLPLDVASARKFVMAAPTFGTRPRSSRVQTSLEPTIELRNITSGYGRTPILDRFDWTVYRGEIVGLIGINGAGKTTLLKTIVGLLKPTQGELRLRGERIHGRKLSDIARLVGYVPQNPNSVLFAETLRDELAFTLKNHGLRGDVNALLERFGLRGFADRYPRDLSGGERQRAALAAMLAAQPPIVLLDEPTRGLDYLHKARIATLLAGWAQDGITVVIATHDIEWISGFASRLSFLQNGRLVADGTPEAVMLKTPDFQTQVEAVLNGVPPIL
jgi:energy-coupling factor transport system ATP-binding protein